MKANDGMELKPGLWTIQEKDKQKGRHGIYSKDFIKNIEIKEKMRERER